MRQLFLLIAFIWPILSFSQLEDGDLNKKILDGKFLVFKSNTGYLGIKTVHNEIVVQPQFVNITEIEEGILVVKANKNTGFERTYSSGFLNKQLKTILPCNYRNITSGGNGMLVACQNTDTKYGLVDTLGRIRIPFQYDDIGLFGDGLFPVKLKGYYGYLNEFGKQLIPFEFEFAHAFSEGKAGVKKHGLYGFIDKHGRFVINEKFQEVSPFQFGYASVRINDFATIIDSKGNLVFPPVFETIDPIENGLFVFSCMDQLRDTLGGLVKRVEGKAKVNFQNIEGLNPNKYINDTLIPFEDEFEPDFKGLISIETGLISDKCLRSCNFLIKRNGHHFFAVQCQNEILKNDNWNYALMNEKGEILTGYKYFEIRTIGTEIFAEKELESINYSVLLNDLGEEKNH